VSGPRAAHATSYRSAQADECDCTVSYNPSGNSGDLFVQFYEFIASLLNDIFGDLFSGGGSPPVVRQLMYKSHPLYVQILGIQPGLVPSEGSAADGAGVLILAQASVGGSGSGDPLLDPNTPDVEKERIVRELEARLAQLPANSKERKKIERRLREYRKRPSKRAHGADTRSKFAIIPWIPEAPLEWDAAESALGAAEAEGAADALEMLLGLFAF